MKNVVCPAYYTQTSSDYLGERPLYSIVRLLRTLNVMEGNSILALVYICYARFHQIIYYNVAHS